MKQRELTTSLKKKKNETSRILTPKKFCLGYSEISKPVIF